MYHSPIQSYVYVYTYIYMYINIHECVVYATKGETT